MVLISMRSPLEVYAIYFDNRRTVEPICSEATSRPVLALRKQFSAGSPQTDPRDKTQSSGPRDGATYLAVLNRPVPAERGNILQQR